MTKLGYLCLAVGCASLVHGGYLLGYERGLAAPTVDFGDRWHEVQIKVGPDGTVETRDCVIDVAPLDESLGADIRPFWLNFWGAHRSPPAPPPERRRTTSNRRV